MSSTVTKIGKIFNTWGHKLDRIIFPIERRFASSQAGPSEATGSRRMLLVTTDYPPIVSGGIYRTVGLVTAAKARGWAVDVAATRVSHKGRSTDPYMAARARIADQVLDIPPPPKDIKRSWIRDVHGGMDQAMATFRQVSRAMAAPDFVVASGPSFLSFVAAYWLARHWDAGLVLDYRDEWTTHAHRLFLRTPGYEQAWERRCLEQARWITVTTGAQKANLVRGFGLERREADIIVLPNGWDREDCHDNASIRVADARETRPQLGYFGSLRKTTFIPALFSALAEPADDAVAAQLQIYGDIRVEEPLLDQAVATGRVVLHDNVPKSEVFGLMAGMDLLIASFAEGLGDYLPGKLADYLASDRPILFIGPEGEAAKLVRELGAGEHVTGDDEGAITNAIKKVLNTPSERYETAARMAWRAQNERWVLMARLLDPLEAALSAARS